MSTWNGAMANAFFTTPVDANTPVNTEREKVKVGYPCDITLQESYLSFDVFGKLESVTCEFTWDRHPRMPDMLFQYDVLAGKPYHNFA